MRIVNFKGGLGNQMSIYLFALWLGRRHPGERIYGSYWSGTLREHTSFQLDRVFHLTLPPRSWLTDQLSRMAYLMERLGIVSTEETRRSLFYNGTWLDKRYWKGIDIGQTFTFDCSQLSERNLEYQRQIVGSNSVAVHVRRGDYQSPQYKAWFGDFCTPDYYRRAIDAMRERGGGGLKFFVFSDDLAWARSNLGLEDAVCVEGNDGDDSWADMYLMSLCHHNIIANSTFSFWAAMLNSHSDKLVTYPRRWFVWPNPDIFPESWMPL